MELSINNLGSPTLGPPATYRRQTPRQPIEHRWHDIWPKCEQAFVGRHGHAHGTSYRLPRVGRASLAAAAPFRGCRHPRAKSCIVIRLLGGLIGGQEPPLRDHGRHHRAEDHRRHQDGVLLLADDVVGQPIQRGRVTGRVPTNLATISGVAFQASKVAFKAADRVLSCARRRTSLPRVMTCSLGRMVEAGGTRATKTLM
jgi:hypothetical protein